MTYYGIRLFSLILSFLLGACTIMTSSLPASKMSLTELQTNLTLGSTSSEALVRELVDKAAQNERLNAFITLDAIGALEQAKKLDEQRRKKQILGPLHGIPLVAKDNIHVAGLPNTAGTPALSDFVPAKDSPVIATLKDAGAIILGKTNMHEMAFGITSNNFTYGAVANPRNTEHFAGGSSGGTASAVAAFLAPAGLGTDTGGSVRIPAALTGIASLRPTLNRYSQAGVTPISTTRDTIGPMARNLRDVALLDAVITGTDTEIKPADLNGIRLGLSKEYFYTGLDPETQRLTDEALARLKKAGVVVVEADIPDLAELSGKIGFPVVLFETVRDLGNYLEEHETGVSLQDLTSKVASPDVKPIFDSITGDGAVSYDVYLTALTHRVQLQKVYAEYFKSNRLDAMVFPTTPLPSRPIANSLETVELNGDQVPTFPTYIRNTDPGSLVGIPGITLPIGNTFDGLPVGLELDGPENSDRRLLSIGLAIENLLGQ